jgi:hypothetical protein
VALRPVVVAIMRLHRPGEEALVRTAPTGSTSWILVYTALTMRLMLQVTNVETRVSSMSGIVF